MRRIFFYSSALVFLASCGSEATPGSVVDETDSSTTSQTESQSESTTASQTQDPTASDTGSASDSQTESATVDTESLTVSDEPTDSESSSTSQTETASDSESVSVPEPDGSCEAPFQVEALPFLQATTTTGGIDHLGVYADSCGTGAYPGPDLVYELTVEAGTIYDISVWSIGALDAVIAVLDTCAQEASCTAFANDTGPGGSENLTLSPDEDGTVFIVVDSAGTDGQLALSISSYPLDTDTGSQSDTGTDTETIGDTETPSDTGTASESDTDTSAEPLDFGDALDVDKTDLLYPTLLAHDGARHQVQRFGCFLGLEIDDELDAPAFNPGYGDDLTDLDDEDGVELRAIVAGQGNTVETWLSCAGLSVEMFLQGWIDFNGDYDWDDKGEQIFVNVPLSEGLNLLKFDAPKAESNTITFARFRLSSTQDLLPSGLAPDGEVEDYSVQILTSSSADYGDLPEAPYQTSRESGGPYHLISKGVFLGESVDVEEDGQPNEKALGDDDSEEDDEDGVIPPTADGLVFPPGKNTLSVVTVCEAAVKSCVLQAWIDFNQDGDFKDKGEHIANNLRLSTGKHEIELNVPILPPHTAVDTYLRLRYSTQSALPATGFAPDGEVEDYMIRFQAPIGPAPL